MKLDEANWTVFDVETTGLFPYGGDRICEIGAVRVDSKGKVIDKFHTMVDPKRAISPGAFRVNGITKDMLKGAPDIEAVLPEFLDFIRMSILCGYNVGFDLGFIEYAVEDKDILNNFFIVDVLSLSRRLFPNLDRYPLWNVAQHLGIDVSGRHRALDDAIATTKIFLHQLSMLIKNGAKTISDIGAVSEKIKQSAADAYRDRITVIEEAISMQQDLKIRYKSIWSNAVTERVITPKEIQRGYRRGYLIAYCHLRKDERSFRLDCITDLELKE